jgi:hypothetical protein
MIMNTRLKEGVEYGGGVVVGFGVGVGLPEPKPDPTVKTAKREASAINLWIMRTALQTGLSGNIASLFQKSGSRLKCNLVRQPPAVRGAAGVGKMTRNAK